MQLTDTQLLLITQFGFPVVCGLVAYLYRHLVARLPEQKRAKVESIVNQVVQAVEQAQSLVPGQVKKEYATNMVNTLLKSSGVKASPEQVDVLIEAAVYAINQNRSGGSTKVVPAL